MAEHELADFEPSTGHLHGCDDAANECSCLGHLFAVAEDEAIEGAAARRAVGWVVEAAGGRVVVPRNVMERDWRLTAQDTIDGGRRFISASATGKGASDG